MVESIMHVGADKCASSSFETRHKGQLRENPRFFLVNERELADTEKWLIVNCIIDPAKDVAIVHLLDEARAPYYVIRLAAGQYRRIRFGLSGFDQPGSLAGGILEKFGQVKRERVSARKI